MGDGVVVLVDASLAEFELIANHTSRAEVNQGTAWM
jgi:hypothetical protein